MVNLKSSPSAVRRGPLANIGVAVKLLAASFTAIAFATFLHTTRAQDPNANSTLGGTGPIEDEITPEVKDAVKKGLKYLASTQAEDGSFSGNSGYGGGGIVGMAGLAFMADGNMPGQGPYGANVEKILDYVLKNCQESGMVDNTMYGHGFGTLFLAEVYGQSQRADVKDKLQNAVRLIVQSQNKEGGWRYQPIPNDADLSVTICQVMALRAARNAGIEVPKLTIDRAIDYVKKSQEPDGGFRYMLNSAGSSFPRSAAGVAVLFYSGIYEGKEIDNGVKYVMQSVPGTGNQEGMYFYGNYYAAQAMFMKGGEAWRKWWPAIKKDLVSKQQTDGSWQGDVGNPLSTSMALIILEIPNRILPILQK